VPQRHLSRYELAVPTQDPSEGPPAAKVLGTELSAPEAKQLSWLLDGGIMHSDVRRQMRRSRGMCPRHTWAYAMVECELRGGVPFSASILYADLAASMGRTIARARWLPVPTKTRVLHGDRRCFTCEYLELRRDDSGASSDAACKVNRLARFTGLMRANRVEATHRACPLCIDGGGGMICRSHLAERRLPWGLARELRELADRVQVFTRSLTVDGPDADAVAQAAWIEALGWFAGWDVAKRVL
jgi:hypothetical protein